MRLLPSHNAVTLLLTALLLANGISAHGFDHAHAGGDESHSHADDAVVRHGHSSQECPRHNDHPENHPHKCESYLTAASVSHVHLTLLGFDFSFPDSDNSNGGDDASRTSTFLRLSNDCTVKLLARSLNIDLLRTLSLKASAGDVVAIHSATSAAPQVPSAPLCDRARFERSDVLLI
jgi:hypothetical protein